jgi:hypothetical protein
MPLRQRFPEPTGEFTTAGKQRIADQRAEFSADASDGRAAQSDLEDPLSAALVASAPLVLTQRPECALAFLPILRRPE